DEENQTIETPQSSQINETCSHDLHIETYENIYLGKIEFGFDTEAENFTINYWVEDLGENIVKDPRETTNTNKKSYTPEDRTNLFNIFAEMRYEQNNETCFSNANE